MRQVVCLVAGALGAVGAQATSAHVAPSDRENNRYILLAPLGDRIRLAYTVYLGQVPGRQIRARMDADRDGRISDSEAQKYGDEIAAQAAPRLSLEVDGQPVAIQWHEVDVGLGQPVTAAGAFAVDLVAWICLDQPRERLAHRVRLRDGFQLPQPGESELRAEESPGVRITRTQLGSGRTETARLEYRWTGGPGPTEMDGYYLEFEVDPALATFAGACDEPDASGGDSAVPRVFVIAGLLALGAAAWLVSRRRVRR